MTSFFNQPYPLHRDTRRILVVNAFVGLFVMLFLYIFRPFGINEISAGRYFFLAIAGYGLITYLSCVLFFLGGMYFFPKWFSESSWTAGREIISLCMLIVPIAFGNTLYTDVLTGSGFHLGRLIFFLGATVAVGIFPLTITVLLKQNRLRRINEQGAGEINREIRERPTRESLPVEMEAAPAVAEVAPAEWLFTGENSNEKIRCTPATLLFIESADNYSTFCLLDSGALKKQLIRGSLRSMEQKVPDPKLFRCHRSFIVNLAQVKSVSGNAQGYRLHFSDPSITIPVSRTAGKELRGKLVHFIG